MLSLSKGMLRPFDAICTRFLEDSFWIEREAGGAALAGIVQCLDRVSCGHSGHAASDFKYSLYGAGFSVCKGA